MIDAAFKERIDRVNEATSWSSILPEATERGTITCPFCLRKSKAYLYDSFFKCFSSKCGIAGDKINIYTKLNNIKYMEALVTLETQSCLDPASQAEEYTKRNSILLDVQGAYHNELFKHPEVYQYLEQRGFQKPFIDMMQIGYASHEHILSTYEHINKNTLIRHGLSNIKNEFFRNRIMFPIFDKYNYLVHLTGRKFPDDGFDDFKYLDSRAVPVIGSCKNYLIFENEIDNYLKTTDTIYLVEGVPDSFILKQEGFAVVGLMGLQKILHQASKLKKFKKIIAMFDNDRFESNHPLHPMELKSWRIVTNQLIDLQLYYGKEVDIEVFMVPEHKTFKGGYAKDINDLFLLVGKDRDYLEELIHKNKKHLIEDFILTHRGDISNHKTILKLIGATGKFKRMMQEYIPKDYSDNPLEYAIKVLSL